VLNSLSIIANGHAYGHCWFAGFVIGYRHGMVPLVSAGLKDGLMDLVGYGKYMSGQLSDYEYPESEIARNLEKLKDCHCRIRLYGIIRYMKTSG